MPVSLNVVDLGNKKRKNWDVPTKGQVLYRSFNYKGTTYGIWAFERAVFRYIGKNGKGAPKNLAYAGNCVVSAEDTAGTKSIVLTFELPETAKLHQVVKDDTLYNLSLKYGTTVDEIVKMNADKVKDANKIYLNDVLRVRH
ncbi:hypothetical protein RvY_02781-2 [Ramazzottius varieornatus]|uniref:LysM domain-containing protein n=1 Tax=Ramazzottius varieornatus TaxID=947166 RepID=A0A1D1UPN6_RAMVA|nr:hypothetical protein RvY_02781-2 [Ramazzottius varieornatus]